MKNMREELQEALLKMAGEEQRALAWLFLFLAILSFLLAFWQARREGKPHKTLPLGAFLVGVVASVFFVWWVCGLLLYVAGAGGDAPPCMFPAALVPRWIFLFCPLVLLGAKREIQRSAEELLGEVVEAIGKFFDRLLPG